MHMLEFRRHLALPAMESARVLNMHMYMHTNVTLTLTPGHRAPAELAARPSLLIARFSASSSASTSPAVCNLPFNALRVNALRVIVHTSTRVNAYRLSHIAYRVCNSHPPPLNPGRRRISSLSYVLCYLAWVTVQLCQISYDNQRIQHIAHAYRLDTPPQHGHAAPPHFGRT